ncbi:MAG: hypothetical protein QW738_05165 [Nitrososphaeria archaeon]
MEKDRIFTSILLIAGLISVTLAVLLARIWCASGMTTSLLISEAFVNFSMLSYLSSVNLIPVKTFSVRQTFSRLFFSGR